MTDKEINKKCPHINLTDWGSYSCKLYDPYVSSEKALVQYGTCEANTYCPYKQAQRKEDECNRYKKALEEIRKECKCFGRSTYTQEYDRIYGGQLDTNIIETINEALEDEK